MFERLKKAILRVLTHRSLHLGLSACHLSAAALTGKPEVYGPMAVLYLLLAVLPER